MALEIITGSALVLLTWVFAAVAVAAYGRWVPLVVDRRVAPDRSWRAGLWWGLGLVTVAVLVVAMAVPLGSGAAAAVLALVGVALAAVGVVLRRPRGPQWPRPRPAVLVLLGAFTFSLAYLAVKALGPATNYDTGLYHLGAVKYAHDFAAIPGLASLYFPFGYANAQFPLAAVLGNGPWDGIGYRLLNGAIILLALTDLGSRLLNRRWSWGTSILAIGLSASLVPLVAMADGLVTSPTADTSVLVLTIVSTAYLADALTRPRMSVDLSVALVVAALTVMLRPTMGFFALGTVLVALLVSWRRRGGTGTTAGFWILTTSAVAVMALVVVLRDRILSGWLLYPLSVVSFDVPWLADDATPWRTGTLAAARDPLAPDGYVVAHSWVWIGPWLSRVFDQWEGWYLLLGLAVTVAVVLLARRRCGFPLRPRLLLLVMAPSALATVTWFVLSPPSFRFIWGPLFCLLFVPLSGAVHALARAGTRITPSMSARSAVLVACSACIIAVTGYSAIARNQVDQIAQERTWSLLGVSLPYAVAPVPRPPVTPVTMSTGLVVFVPVDGDQCWDNYPLCTFSPGDNVALLGGSIQDGFTRSR